jgi:hypothetical protein
MENAPKNGLRKYYDSLPERQHVAPKKEFIKHLAEITKVYEGTVRGWLYGAFKPDALRQDIIAKDLGMTVEELFD